MSGFGLLVSCSLAVAFAMVCCELLYLKTQIFRLVHTGGEPGRAPILSPLTRKSLDALRALRQRLQLNRWENETAHAPLALNEAEPLTDIARFAAQSLRMTSSHFRSTAAAFLYVNEAGALCTVTSIELSKRFESALAHVFENHFRGDGDAPFGCRFVRDEPFALRALESFGIDCSLSASLDERGRGGLKAVLWFGYGLNTAPLPIELKRFEELRSQMQVQLRAFKSIGALSDRLTEAEGINREKSEFIAHISHDIRSPLHNIRTVLSLLGEEIPDADSKSGDIRELIDTALVNCDGLAELVEGVLDFSRHQAGKLSAHVAPLDIGVLCRELTSAFSVSAHSKGLNLRCDAPAHLYALADRKHIRRVLSNLLSNAIKYTSRGEILLRCSVEAETVCIEVVDSGPGISMLQLSKLFMPFERLGETVQGGVGLGLALSKILIELNAGQITVDSVEGRGSSFRLTLPRSVKFKQTIQSTRQGPVIIIDDDRDTVDSLARLLNRHGIATSKAYSVSEGRHLLANTTASAVIIDFFMPEGGGSALVSELKSRSDLIVIAISGASDISKLTSQLGEQVRAVLTKPVDISELLRFLSE